MKTIIILFVLCLAACSKPEQIKPTEAKSKTPYYLVTDTTTDNSYQHD